MLHTTRLVFTHHALQRFRERIKPDGTAEDMEQRIRSASCRPVGYGTYLQLRQRCIRHPQDFRRGTRKSFWKLKDEVYLLECLRAGLFRVVSCWLLLPDETQDEEKEQYVEHD